MGLTYIASVTASSSATLSFTTGIDSTYNEYQFHMVNMHPATDSTAFGFQFNADGGSGFNETITSTFFKAEHNEGDSGTGLGYHTPSDQAQGTAYQRMSYDMEIDNDEAFSGILTLYAPSSTTYVKHFTARANESHYLDTTIDYYSAGYINTTNAIDEISFQFSSGNIDAGVIKMYGIATS